MGIKLNGRLIQNYYAKTYNINRWIQNILTDKRRVTLNFITIYTTKNIQYGITTLMEVAVLIKM